MVPTRGAASAAWAGDPAFARGACRPLRQDGVSWHRAGMTSVSALYEQRVAAGQIAPDPAQRSTLPALDQVLADLAQTPRRAARPPVAGGRSLAVRRLPRRPPGRRGCICGVASGVANPC